MPRATKIQSERDLWDAVRGVPTKWFPPVHLMHKGREETIVFRLYIKKRGGTLHIETSPNSPSYPGLTIPVLTSKKRYGNFIHAGECLTRTFMADPNRSPAYPLSVWNKKIAIYHDRNKNFDMVVRFLMELVDPQRGRPFNAPPMTQLPPGIPLGRTGARSVRKSQLTGTLGDMQDTLTTVLSRVQDGRYMSGYTKDERGMLHTMMSEIRDKLKTLQTKVHTDTIILSAATAPAENRLAELKEFFVNEIKPSAPSTLPDSPVTTGLFPEIDALTAFDEP
jgi:hypothetical protein